MLLPNVPWRPFTTPAFSDWVLLLHWGSVLFASVSFLYGFITHWSRIPEIMTAAYSMMALVCFIETFGYMTSETKYIVMTAEFLTNTIILLLLYRSDYYINYFNT